MIKTNKKTKKMLSKTLIYNIAIFLIYLIVTLPIYISSVFAYSQIDSVKIYGNDNIDSVVRKSDTLKSIVRIINTLYEVQPEQVTISGAQYSSCNLEDESRHLYACSYDSGKQRTQGDVYNYQIKYSPPNEAVKTHTKTVAVDNTPPIINAVSSNKPEVGRESVTFIVTATDFSNQKAPQVCAGLKQIKIYTCKDMQLIATQDIEQPNSPNECTKTVYITKQVEELGVSSGTQKLCFTAVDWFNQESAPKEFSQTFDITEPALISAGLTFKGKAINYVPSKKVPEETGTFKPALTIKIEEIGTSISAIRIQTKDLNGVQQVFTDVNKCVPDDTVYTCSFDNVKIDIDQETYINLNISVEDRAGNKKEETIGFSLGIDDTGPQVVKIFTNTQIGGNSFFKKGNNTLIVQLNELESGLDASMISARIGDASWKSADSCDQNHCYWNVTLAEPGIYSISINPQSTDIAQNPIKGDLTTSIAADYEAPEVLEMNYSVSVQQYSGLIVYGDTLLFTAKIRDKFSSNMHALGNYSIIGGADYWQPGDCVLVQITEEGRYFDCNLVSTILINQTGNSTILFKFYDDLGNEVFANITIFTTALKEEKVDEWEVKAGDPTPSAIDRRLNQVIPGFQYFPITLSRKIPADKAWPYEIQVVSCDENSSLILENGKPQVLNFNTFTDRKETGDYTFYLKYQISSPSGMPLDPSHFANDTKKIKCVIGIRNYLGKRPSRLLTNYEYENLTVEMKFFNSPYGRIDVETAKKIHHIKETWITDLKLLDTLEKWVNNIRRLCNMIYAIYRLWMVITHLDDLFKVKCTPATPPICGLQQLMAAASDTTKIKFLGLENYLNPLCKMINCQLSFFDYLKDIKGSKEEGNQQSPGSENDQSKGGWWSGASCYTALRNKIEKTHKGFNYTDTKFTSVCGFLNPYDSIVWAFVTVCLPGMIYNINKLRQIRCNYMLCLMNSAQLGMPKRVCSYQNDIALCKYIIGQVLDALPWVAFAKYIAQLIRGILSSWQNILGFVMSLACSKMCRVAGPPPGCWICHALDTANLIKDVLCDLGYGCDTAVWERGTDINEDLCPKALELYEELKIEECAKGEEGGYC